MSIEIKPPAGVNHQFEGTSERISWQNFRLSRNMPLYVLHTIGFLFFLPLTLFLLIQLIREQFGPAAIKVDWTGVVVSSIFILLFGMVVYVTASKLLSLSWREEIEIAEDAIFLRTHGLLSGKAREIKVAEIWRLSFEKYQHNQEQEFRYSVNIFHKRREQLAYWMRQDDGQQLYNLLASIIKRRGWDGLIKMEERGYVPRS